MHVCCIKDYKSNAIVIVNKNQYDEKSHAVIIKKHNVIIQTYV